MYKIKYLVRKYLYRNRNYLNLFILILGIIVAAAVGINYYYMSYKKSVATYEENAVKLMALKKEIRSLTLIRDNERVFDKKLKEIESIENKLNDILPTTNDVPLIVSQITLAADNADVKIISMSKIDEAIVTADAGENAQKFEVYRYAVGINGRFESFAKFLNYLERTRNVFSVGYISVSRPEKITDSEIISADLIINIYLKPEVKQ